MNAPVLIVDDEAPQRAIMTSILGSEGWKTIEAGGVDAALKMVEEHQPGVILTDLKMQKKTGLELVEAVVSLPQPPEVVVITAYGSVETSVRAMKLGAYDYLTKPLEREELLIVVRRAMEKYQLRIDGMRMRDEFVRQTGAGFIAQSENMKEIMALLPRIAESDASVLITGETGTGKERIARFIHQMSPRASRPMQAINCAAFPETLLESELFGYEKGAFTGAQARKIGIFESVSGGTLFLDEIADMSLNTQAKVLRSIQEKEVRRLGGTGTVPVDFRVVAATNKNLDEYIKKGAFREDLFYRLSVIPICLPPLRDRRSDIPVLVDALVARRGKKKVFSAPALELLCQYRWPGNIRELEAVVERSIILTAADEIKPENMPPEIRYALDRCGAAEAIVLPEKGIVFENWEKSIIEQALDRSKGVLADAARLLGMTYRTLQYRAAKFGLIKHPDIPDQENPDQV
jgi:DNA-binding NtrC family response regulator